MPVVVDISIQKDIRIIGWQIEENPDELLSMLPHKLQQEGFMYKLPSRRSEFAASRLCILHAGFSSNIQYLPSGKPIIDDGFLSITHTDGFAAAIVSRSQMVAIDAEHCNPRILRTASRFLSDKEAAYCNNDVEKITLMWCCKECMYKLFGFPNISFKEDIAIDVVSRTEMLGRIKNKNNIILKRTIGDEEKMPLLVWCSSQNQSVL